MLRHGVVNVAASDGTGKISQSKKGISNFLYVRLENKLKNGMLLICIGL